MPVQTRTTKKLVLARETLRTLARPRATSPDLVAVVTSCGRACTCDCDTQTF